MCESKMTMIHNSIIDFNVHCFDDNETLTTRVDYFSDRGDTMNDASLASSEITALASSSIVQREQGLDSSADCVEEGS